MDIISNGQPTQIGGEVTTASGTIELNAGGAGVRVGRKKAHGWIAVAKS
jgi:hypothetical protein